MSTVKIVYNVLSLNQLPDQVEAFLLIYGWFYSAEIVSKIRKIPILNVQAYNSHNRFISELTPGFLVYGVTIYSAV
jgi:hypothetical protein